MSKPFGTFDHMLHGLIFLNKYLCYCLLHQFKLMKKNSWFIKSLISLVLNHLNIALLNYMRVVKILYSWLLW
jgi:hypothetical protein